MNITIQCFGTYRNFAQEVILVVASDARVGDLRAPLLAELQKIDPDFDDIELLKRSKFATETDLLLDRDLLSEDMVLAIIPPVSGG